MATDCIALLTFRYQRLGTPIVARFDVPHASSDGGLVLLKAVDDRLHLTEAMARCLTDPRQPGKVAHSVLDLVRQRVFGLTAGYLDGNDAARLADDPLHKLMLDREPLTGPALGSQPTLSRFENGISRRDLVRMGQGLARTVIAHHRRPTSPLPSLSARARSRRSSRCRTSTTSTTARPRMSSTIARGPASPSCPGFPWGRGTYCGRKKSKDWPGRGTHFGSGRHRLAARPLAGDAADPWHQIDRASRAEYGRAGTTNKTGGSGMTRSSPCSAASPC